MDTELIITAEQVDDFVLLITMMAQMGLPAILDRHIPRHWLQEGLRWGWMATIWLAHIVSQGDHLPRKRLTSLPLTGFYRRSPISR